MMDKLYNLTSMHWLPVPVGQVKSRGLGAGLRASHCTPLEDYGAIFNFYFKFFYYLFLDLQGEHRLQEQGMFWKGYFGDGAGRTFALVESERLKYLVSLARAGSCSLSPWFWLTVGVLPQPCSSHSFFSCSIYIENPSREAAATGFPWEPMWNCMAVDKIKRKKKNKFGSRGGNQTSFFSQLSFIHRQWMKWCFRVSQPYSILAPRRPECVPWSTPKKRQALYPVLPTGPPQPTTETKIVLILREKNQGIGTACLGLLHRRCSWPKGRHRKISPQNPGFTPIAL